MFDIPNLEKFGATQMTEMFDWITFEKGNARFCGFEKGTDEAGHRVFAVQLGGPVTYYGEFALKFEPDHTNYNIEIISCGYHGASNIANPSPTARAQFTSEEIAAIRSVITELIFSYRAGPVPIPHTSHFAGQIRFREGWGSREIALKT
jgi:hypothetical protein